MVNSALSLERVLSRGIDATLVAGPYEGLSVLWSKRRMSKFACIETGKLITDERCDASEL